MMIFIAMILMIVGALVVFAFIGRAIARRVAPDRQGLIMVLTALAGAGLGWLWVMATFYESSWSPPPQIQLAIAPGFDAPVVLILEDRGAGQRVQWHESSLPFTRSTAQIAVPPSGIVRVHDLGAAEGRADLSILWPDGTEAFGAGGGPGPPGIGAASYMMIERAGAQAGEAERLSSSPEALAAYVMQREGRR
jgi:hypothetical protein